MRTRPTDHHSPIEAGASLWPRRLSGARGPRLDKFLRKPSLMPGLTSLALIALGLGAGAGAALAFSQGPNFAGTQAACSFTLCGASTGANDSSCSMTNSGSPGPHSISLTNFGLSLPTSVTSIDGILVEPKALENECLNPTIQLLKNGSLTGSSKTFTPVHVTGASVPCIPSDFVAVGGSSDTWGANLTRADIVASGFGVQITAPPVCSKGLALDAVRITVFFSIATPVCGDGFTTGGEACDDSNTNRGDGCSAKCQLETALDVEQQKCVNTLNKDGIGIVSTQSKANLNCIKAAAAGKEADAQGCLTADENGKVQKVGDKATADAAALCSPAPPFGFISSGAITTAAVNEPVGLMSDLFGANLTPAIIPKAEDKVGAACQSALAKAAQNLMRIKAKLFLNCKKKGLKDTADQQFLSGADLEECFDTLQADAKGTIAKAVAKIASTVDKQCAGVNLTAAFPGQCSGAADLVTCVDEQAECRVCRLFNAMDGLSEDCDLFDDGVSNASCP